MGDLMILLAVFLFISICINCFLGFRLITKKKQKQPTYDAKAVLRELMNGEALIKIEVVDKESIFIRSPRDLL